MSKNNNQKVVDFITLHDTGILSTISKSIAGYPFGSVTPYDVCENLGVYIHISKIAEHYKNLVADPRASICIQDPYGISDPQANGRATLVGDFEQIPEDQSKEVEKRYFKRFPKAPHRAIAHDFVFFRLTVKKLRWIGGFGSIHWISANDYNSAKFDPIAYVGKGIIDHMNEDHKSALVDFIRFHHKVVALEQNLRMESIDRVGFEISFQKGSEKTRYYIPFPEQVTQETTVRKAMIEMLKICRAG